MSDKPDPLADVPPRLRDALYHFCRVQHPEVPLALVAFRTHLGRTLRLCAAKANGATGAAFFDNLHAADWYLCCACLEGDRAAWRRLFAARANRADCLLVDALRARAARLYPRNEERQETAVTEFWSHLIVMESAERLPILARYDGQRPLVPWLIRVFQNWHISVLRQQSGVQGLPDDDVALPLPDRADTRWHEAFCQAAREALGRLKDDELLILGLRFRYRLSQREVAGVLGIHEGNVSRRTDALRDRFLDAVAEQLREQGWTGDDLHSLVLNELGGLLVDEPRLAADRLAATLAKRGKRLPEAP